MRILAFVSEYPRVHGAQRSFLQTLRALPGKGIEPIVVMPGDGAATDLYRAAGLDVRVLPGAGVQQRFGVGLLRSSAFEQARTFVTDVLPYGRSVAALARREGATLVHAMTARSTLAIGVPCRTSGVPVVGHVRGMLTPYGRLQREALAQSATRFVSVAASIVTAFPSSMRRRTTVVHNAVDEASVRGADEASRVRTELGASGDDVVVAIVGSVEPAKGHHELFHALSVARFTRNVHVLVVGSASDPAYGHHVRALSAGIPRVRTTFVGWTPNPFAYHAAADILVLPSVTRDRVVTAQGVFRATSGEGLPRTILEAMYLGRPVVAYDMAGVREQVIDGVTGRLVREHDVEGLGHALVELASDRSLRARMGAAAAVRCRTEFSTERMVSGIVSVYEQALAGAP